jgi:hypothetical protein
MRRVVSAGALAFATVASATAAVGWARTPVRDIPAPSIRIVDVRPLHSPNAGLRDIITHTFAVRVAVDGWQLLPYKPGTGRRDNRPGAGHWRLYLDGHPLGDNLGGDLVTYTYVPAGTHWIAAELSNADSSSLRPPIWSEPVILHVPRTIRCWQNGWHGSPATGTPTFVCTRPGARTDSSYSQPARTRKETPR